MSESLYYIDAGGIFSKSLLGIVRIKLYKGKLEEFDITKKGSAKNEANVYKEIIQVLRSRLENDYATTVVQDQQLFERRSTLNDPEKFKALGIRIEEKKLVDAALRRAEFLEKGLLEETLHQTLGVHGVHELNAKLGTNKDLV